MVRVHDVDALVGKPPSLGPEHCYGRVHVTVQKLALAQGDLTALGQEVLGQVHLADVLQQGGRAEDVEIPLGQPEISTHRQAQHAHRHAVVVGVLVPPLELHQPVDRIRIAQHRLHQRTDGLPDRLRVDGLAHPDVLNDAVEHQPGVVHDLAGDDDLVLEVGVLRVDGAEPHPGEHLLRLRLRHVGGLVHVVCRTDPERRVDVDVGADLTDFLEIAAGTHGEALNLERGLEGDLVPRAIERDDVHAAT